MAANPYQTKRIQVVFDQETRDAVEAFAADRGLTLSKATAFLAKEALLARGQLQAQAEETTEVKEDEPSDTTPREKGLSELLEENTGIKMQLVSKKVERLPTEDAQMLKLRLMQDLMEQLKNV